MAAGQKKNAGGDDMSMEEILQSIKKIIADENDDAAPAPTAGAEEAAPVGSDVLELTDIVAEETTAAESVDVLQQIDNAVEAAAPAPPPPPPAPAAPAPEPAPTQSVPTPDPVIAKPAAAPTPVQDSDILPKSPRLLSDDAATVSAAAFQKVIQTHKATTPMPQFRDGNTIEDLVLETLKPLLKEWLDANLPPMVERIVEREIRKLVD